MKRLLLAVALIGAASLSACLFEDFGPERVVKDPTAPTFSVAGGGDASGASTVCAGYAKERATAAEALQSNPNDQDLLAQIASLDAMINDACR